MAVELNRRSLITGLISLVAAPAIVRAGSLMPVKLVELSIEDLLRLRIADAERVLAVSMQTIIYGNSEWMPLRFSGVELFFDPVAPKDTVYLFSESAVDLGVK